MAADGTRGRVQLLVDIEEINWLRYFRDHVEDALGPASDDVIDMIREEYKQAVRIDLPESEK